MWGPCVRTCGGRVWPCARALGGYGCRPPGASPGDVGFCAFGVDLCALGVGFYALGVGFYALTGRDHVGVVPVMRHRAR